MLIPAILCKEAIQNNFKQLYYTDDMMYESATLDNWFPEIADKPDACTYQYAIVDDLKNLKGYISYVIDWYSSSAYNFGLISFDRGNPIIGEALYCEMVKLLNTYKLHRVEWRVVSGNPVEKHYDKFCNQFNGRKIELKDVFKDREGNYRSCYIYEIIQ